MQGLHGVHKYCYLVYHTSNKHIKLRQLEQRTGQRAAMSTNTVQVESPASQLSLEAIAAIPTMIQKLDTLTTEVRQTNTEVKEMRLSITNIEKWIQNKEEEDKEASALRRNMECKINVLESKLEKLQIQVENMNREQKLVHEQNLKLDTYSRRDNLVLDGIPEADGESDTVCLDTVYDILINKMSIQNAREMRIVRCHRLGSKVSGARRPRSIIFRLHWFGDRQTIWNARQNLKGTNIFISENFPPEIEQRRRILYPVMKAAQNLKHKAYLVVDKLHIEGIGSFTVDNLKNLPANLDPMKISTPSKGNITAFFSSASPLSNFHKTNIKGPDGTNYTSSEQMYQHKKALRHNDEITAARIMNCKTPLEAYNLGKKVAELTKELWYTEENAKETMFQCCLAKFSQNHALRDFLLSTGSSELVEGNPRDSLWGVALHVSIEKIFSHNEWKGKNWMGDILKRVCDALK